MKFSTKITNLQRQINYNSMKLVVLTGAGISAESGIKTFRDSDGLWENYSIDDVCTAEALQKNPELVFDFYNQRRKDAMKAEPNFAHKGLVELEQRYDVQIITQNVDDLHERAGSKHILHLHGELTKCRSMIHTDKIYDMPERGLTYGEKGPDGTLLRPHIVFFNEAVPNIEPAIEIVKEADILVIIGTSMVVYPAAGLLMYAKRGIPIYVIDPKIPALSKGYNITAIEKTATEGVKELLRLL